MGGLRSLCKFGKKAFKDVARLPAVVVREAARPVVNSGIIGRDLEVPLQVALIVGVAMVAGPVAAASLGVPAAAGTAIGAAAGGAVGAALVGADVDHIYGAAAVGAAMSGVASSAESVGGVAGVAIQVGGTTAVAVASGDDINHALLSSGVNAVTGNTIHGAVIGAATVAAVENKSIDKAALRAGANAIAKYPAGKYMSTPIRNKEEMKIIVAQNTFEKIIEEYTPEFYEWYEKYQSASGVIEALENLPPTYNDLRDEIFQFVPDPISDTNIDIKLKNLQDRQKEFQDVLDKYRVTETV